MSREKPISMRSFNSILEIIQKKVDEDIPEEEVKREVLSHNREFYKQASDEELKLELLTRLMTESKVAEHTGHERISDDIDEVVDSIEPSTDGSFDDSTDTEADDSD